ncbi:hypothetical protein [Schinkia azotoformans]|uniref:hypothetical protein n=1 Tax=Schinkia azotoformans TaxID=1454 RepID=UPI002DB73F87|nr:hypothetical protein [Schinkia azotoformans]MEC1780060.1 hypothetical protein [Schinkia azotoformans]MED4330861.1 hypothetical protein [Schinkia azotoformans]
MLTKNKFSWFQLNTQIRCEEFNNFAENIESFLTNKVSEIEADFEKRASQLTKDEQSEFFEMMFEEEYHNFSNSFPSLLRQSLFLTVYAFFEQQLIGICKTFERQNQSIKLKDLKHKGITAAQFYLKRVVKLPFPDDTDLWIKIKSYSELRNHFAHNNKLSDKEVIASLHKIQGLKIDCIEHNKTTHISIELQKEFILEFLDIIYEFLTLLNSISIEHKN